MNWSLHHWIVQKKKMADKRRRSERLITQRKRNLLIKKNVSESHEHHEHNERLAHKSEYLFRQVQEIRKKEAMILHHICLSRAVLSYLTEQFKVRLTNFDHLNILVHV